MPRKLRTLSGRELQKILEDYGFVLKRKIGSHCRLTLEKFNTSFHITIPMHNEIKKGTLSRIINELERCIDLETLEKDFYREK
jgi:predicted RNA binding protein YcfA (HicA-like mRNA interferase family)